MAEYPIHPYIIHCLELLLANAAAPVVLALDGRCGSGKTTMAAALAEQFPDSIVLHTDDFYLPPADRVPGWEQTPCANMDLARLRDEVLAPARAGKPVLYRAYSCREGAYLPVQQLAAQPLVILEGSYSHHPLLQQLRPLPVPREAHPADDQQRQAPQAAARLRRRYADPRLAVCGGSLQGH